MKDKSKFNRIVVKFFCNEQSHENEMKFRIPSFLIFFFNISLHVSIEQLLKANRKQSMLPTITPTLAAYYRWLLQSSSLIF